MKLLDSNIIIYSSQVNFNYLKPLILDQENCVSHISKLEILGFYRLTDTETRYFESVFKILNIISITDNIIDKAIDLRKKRKMKSNDSIIAATALIYKATLYTRNVDDFINITDLQVINPIIGD